jgi:ankyrin repeat protein
MSEILPALGPGSTVQLERTPLLWAVAIGEHDTLRYLIQCGAEVNAADDAGFTGLHDAAEANNATVASILCTASGIDKDVNDVEVSFNELLDKARQLTRRV